MFSTFGYRICASLFNKWKLASQYSFPRARLTQHCPNNPETANPKPLKTYIVSVHASTYAYPLIQRSPKAHAPSMSQPHVFQRRYWTTKPNSNPIGLVRPPRRNTPLRGPLKACLPSDVTFARERHCSGFFRDPSLERVSLLQALNVDLWVVLPFGHLFYDSAIPIRHQKAWPFKEVRKIHAIPEISWQVICAPGPYTAFWQGHD